MADFPIKHTAQEAYDLSYENFQKRLIESQTELNSLIETAIAKGQFSVIYDRQVEHAFYDDIMNLLRNNYGYKVTEKTDDRGKKIWIINWEHPGETTGD